MINIKNGVAGRFKLDAHILDDAGNIVSSRSVTDWFDNLITDNGLNLMGATSGYLGRCQVGTGNTAPANTDTSLVSYVAASNASSLASTSVGGSGGAGTAVNPYYRFARMTYRFDAGTATGNLSEVGISPDATANLYSRALIVDGGGNPTTITVLPAEVLDVTYEHRTYAPDADVTGIITISGANYNYTLRPSSVTTGNSIGGNGSWWGQPIGSTVPSSHGIAGALSTGGPFGGLGAFDGPIGNVTQAPSGTENKPTSSSTAAYSNNSLTRQGTIVWGLNDGNFVGGIDSVRFGFSWCTYQIQFTPALPKDATKTLTLTFSHTWSRA